MAADYLDWYKPVIEVTRGRIVESIHFGAAAVVDSQGKLLASFGNPGAVSFMRSSSKPFQALPFIEMGGAERFNFSSAEIGLICASHSGTDEHFDALTRLQSRIGITETDLMCGTHPPMHKPTAEALMLKGEKLTPNRHNCSGKHTGMLAYARLLGAPISTYLDLDSPVQQNILRTFSEMCEIPVEKVELGIDGCSAPTFAVPLYNAALGMARLSDPHGLGEARETACRKIFSGMTGSPMMVAGPDRFDTLFMTALKGRMLTKAGAEGYQVFGIPAQGAQAGIGIALKISDGDLNDRARDLMGVEILRQMGLISADDMAALSTVFTKKLTNWRKIEIGEIRPCFRLNKPD
ncbi:MAG: asparaginase [Leptolinea sp.]|jgi:L-asparaginase II|nr:asparaginase [Leptolinea sp.]